MIYKFFLSLFFAIFLITCKSTNSDNLNWYDNLEIALSDAQKENKFILINFTGSDWCKWCQKLSNEVFEQKAFEKFANENLILVKIDFPRNIEQSNETKIYNNKLLEQFSVKGFPTIILLDKDGKIKLVTGYQPGGANNYINFLKYYM